MSVMVANPPHRADMPRQAASCRSCRTSGRRMSSPSVPALILIDLQKGMAAAGLPPRNNPQAEENVASLLAAWRSARAPVVHVRHISRTPGSPVWPGSSGVEFQARSASAPGPVLEKTFPTASRTQGSSAGCA